MAAPLSQGSAERRQLTVMFCDLVGSTFLSAQLDPEDLREIIRAYRDRCSEIVAGYEVTLVRYLGDGILVYFGYPHAQEDAAERAIRAALDIISAMPRIQLFGQDLRVRIGIATGLVAVADLIA